MTTSLHRYLGKCQPKFGGCGTGLAMTKDSHESHLWVTCPDCRKRALLKRVEGEYSPGRKCDPRCTSATGNTCTCQCGGANHGADHEMKEVVVAASRVPVTAEDFMPKPVAPEPEPVEYKHIGEVGKSITGKVRVSGKLPTSNDKVLYTFRTASNGDTIKWFVPLAYDPGFEVGQSLTIRAKVTRHSEYRGTPETIVIFVEEIKE